MQAEFLVDEKFCAAEVSAEDKLLLALFCSVFFCVPYFYLQRYPLFAVHTLPLLGVDENIKFSARWVWVYQSAYIIIFAVPLLLKSESDLFCWLKGYVALCLASFCILALYPIACPRPDLAAKVDPMYRLLISYDGKINCFPSLHAALTVYCAVFAFRVPAFKRLSVSNRSLSGAAGCSLIIWALMILFSTVATKQHYFLDLPPALLIAFASYFCSVTCERIKEIRDETN